MRCLLVALSIAMTGQAFGAEWQFFPRIASEAGYESNAALTSSGDELDGTSGQLDARLEIRNTRQRTDFYITPSVSIRRYIESELEPLDAESYFLDTGIEHETERSVFGLRGRYSQRPAYRSELEDAIPDDPDDPFLAGDGELSVLEDQQYAWNVTPYWNYQIGPRNLFSVTGTYIDVKYDEAGSATGRFDYDTTALSLEWEHSYAQRMAIVLRTFAGQYEAENPDTQAENETDNFGATVGIRWRPSETDRFDLNVGVARTDETLRSTGFCTDPGDIAAGVLCDNSEAYTNFTGEARYRRRGERNDINASFGVFANPNSTGRVQIKQEARLFLNRRMSERLTGTIGVVGSVSDGLDSVAERNYLTLQAAFDWRFTRRWSVTGSYRYLGRDTENQQPTTARDNFDNNVVSVGVAWQPN